MECLVAIVDNSHAVCNKYYGLAMVGEDILKELTLGVGVKG